MDYNYEKKYLKYKKKYTSLKQQIGGNLTDEEIIKILEQRENTIHYTKLQNIKKLEEEIQKDEEMYTNIKDSYSKSTLENEINKKKTILKNYKYYSPFKWINERGWSSSIKTIKQYNIFTDLYVEFYKEKQFLNVLPQNKIIRIVGAGPVGLFAAYVFSHYLDYYVEIYEQRSEKDNFLRGQVFIIQHDVLNLIKKYFNALYEALLDSGCLQIFLPPNIKQVSCYDPNNFKSSDTTNISISINKLQSILYNLCINHEQKRNIRFVFSKKISFTEVDKWIHDKTFMVLMAAGGINLEEVTNKLFTVKKANSQDFNFFAHSKLKKAFIIYDKNIDNTIRYNSYTGEADKVGEEWDMLTAQNDFRVFPTKYGQKYIGYLYNPTEEIYKDMIKYERPRNRYTETIKQYNDFKKLVYSPLIDKTKEAYEKFFKNFEGQHKTWEEFIENSEVTSFNLNFSYVLKPYIYVNSTHMVAAGDSNFSPHFFSGMGVNDGFKSIIKIAQGLPCSDTQYCKSRKDYAYNLFGTGDLNTYNNYSHMTRVKDRWNDYGDFFYWVGYGPGYTDVTDKQYEEIRSETKANGDKIYYSKELFKIAYPETGDTEWENLDIEKFSGKISPSGRTGLDFYTAKHFVSIDHRFDPHNNNTPIHYNEWKDIVDDTTYGPLRKQFDYNEFYTFNPVKLIPKKK